MSDSLHCPECGAELPAGAPEQPCPACLMKLGMASWAERQAGSAGSPTEQYSGAFDAPPVQELSPRFPQFDFVELVGKGGMGAVYKARQKSLDRMVAVKIINPRAAAQPGFAERFAREARAMARMNHPNIVTIHDFGSVAAVPSTDPDSKVATALYFLVMEYVEGTNVRQLMSHKQMQPQQALAIVPPLCDALQYAHEEGIVHRDIKPENILVDQKGRVKIADFGLAKLLGRTPRDITLTEASQALGTLHYMAPEQLEHPLDVDHRADIYALGVTFYEMLTGELPLGRFVPPSHKVAVDVRLDEVVLRTLEREPERRYQNASDVKSDVESISATPVQLRSSEPHRRAAADRAALDAAFQLVRFPAIGLVVLGVLLLMLAAMPVATFTAWWFGRQSESGSILVLPAMIVFISLPLATIAGGLAMLRLKSYAWAVAAAVLAVSPIPAGPLWPLSLPFGIWALVVLRNPVVQRGFALRRQTAARGKVAEESVAMAAEQVGEPMRDATRQSAGVFAPGAGPRMLALALGFVTSSLVLAMGAGFLAYGLAMYPAGDGPWGGFVGGGSGALLGGLGGLLGTWNNLRKSQGRVDLMHEPHWNWLDSGFLAFTLVGIAILASGAMFWASLNYGLRITTVLLGGMATLQGLGFSAWRLAIRRAAARPQSEPTLDLRLILVALGMTIGGIMMACGIALLVIVAINQSIGSGPFWGWIGAAFGLIFGGGGGLLGIWNNYRSLEGLPDWMIEAGHNAFDRWTYAIGGLGAVLVLAGLTASPWITQMSVYGLTLLGGILVFQATTFVVIRALMRRAARQEAEHSNS